MSLTTSKLERHDRGSHHHLAGSASGGFTRLSSSQADSDALSNGNVSFASGALTSPSMGSPRLSALNASSGGAGALRSDSDGEAVKVMCRVRPFTKRELELQDELNAKITNEWEKMPLRSVVDIEGGTITHFLDHDKGYTVRQTFNLDHSLWSIPREQQESTNPIATQETVFELIGRPAVDSEWNGYNTCVFAYGQTGSGKTHTMMGSDEEPGLIPRICRALFDEMELKRAAEPDESKKQYRLEGQFLEIYNDKVKDLLWALRVPGESTEGDRENLKIRLIPNVGPQVMGLTTVHVKSIEDCIDLIDEGTRNRSVAATKMNDQSSRSHSIFRLTLTQTTIVPPQQRFEKPKQYHRTSVVSLVDLAGSERNKKSGAEGERLREAVAINKSLTTLKNVIDALVEGRAVVPYRDSTLTWLLSDSLGGNSRTFMIACVSPHFDNAEESLNTLRYAIRTQQIVTHATVNECDELRRMAQMKQDVERLRAQLLDTGEDALRARNDELQASVTAKRTEITEQQQLMESLGAALRQTTEMQFRAAYASRFEEAFSERLEEAYRADLVRLATDVSRLQISNAMAARDLVRVRSAAETAAIEASVSHNRVARLETDIRDLQQKAAELEKQRQRLLDEETDYGDRIARKTPLVGVARRMVRILTSFEAYRCSRVADSTAVALNDHNDEIRASLMKRNAAAKLEREQRIAAARAEQDELQNAIERAKEEQRKVAADFSERKGRLHSTCIFVDNECSRALPTHADSVIVSASKQLLTKQQQSEDEWRRRIDLLNSQHHAKFERQREEERGEDNVLRSEHQAALNNISDAAQAKIRRLRTEAAARLAHTHLEKSRLLECVLELNTDSEAFLREADEAHPRYMPLYAALSTFEISNKRVKPDAAHLLKRMRDCDVEQRRTHTPLAFRTDADEAALSAERSRSVMTFTGDALSHGHSQSERGYATPQRTTHASQPRHDESQRREIKSLKPVTVTAQPTKTSLLRCSLHNYKALGTNATVLQSAAPQNSHGSPLTPRRRNSTPVPRAVSPSPSLLHSGRSIHKQKASSPSDRFKESTIAADGKLMSVPLRVSTYVAAPCGPDGSQARRLQLPDPEVVIFSRSRSPTVTLRHDLNRSNTPTNAWR